MNKARTLIAGLRRNFDEVKNHGVSLEELAEMEQCIAEGEKLSAELDEVRTRANELCHEANEKMAIVKYKMTELKRMVKRKFEQPRWESFGVTDKR